MPVITFETKSKAPARIQRRSTGRAVALALSCTAMAAPALFAADGVIEINQVRALAGGVTPGDGPGFPVTITKPGSYLLTSDLDVRNETSPFDVTAVQFDLGSEGSTLDLNGFSLSGPRAGCSFSNCVTTGTGTGIVIATDWISVRNGFVRGFGAAGLDASDHRFGTFEGVASFENGKAGFATNGHTIRSCLASHNHGYGFSAFYSRVESSQAVANDSTGFSLIYSSATGCASTQNGGIGFDLHHAVLRDAIVSDNGSVSLYCDHSLLGGSQVEGSTFGACTPLEPSYCGSSPCS